MPRFLNPAAIAAPASRYSHGVEHAADARRVVVSGQIGMRPDGSLADGFEAQAAVAFDNLLAVVAETGMAASDLVKVTAFATEPGQVAVFRAVRDRKLGGHAPAATYLEVAGLARPDYLVEIEAEVVKEP
jgi:2-iminobutanoate/2-iminopropanoate deaminase